MPSRAGYEIPRYRTRRREPRPRARAGARRPRACSRPCRPMVRSRARTRCRRVCSGCCRGWRVPGWEARPRKRPDRSDSNDSRHRPWRAFPTHDLYNGWVFRPGRAAARSRRTYRGIQPSRCPPKPRSRSRRQRAPRWRRVCSRSRPLGEPALPRPRRTHWRASSRRRSRRAPRVPCPWRRYPRPR